MAAPDPIREQTFERSLPNSSEAERAILGAVLLDNGMISQAIELLKPEDFYVPSHRRIFVAMTALFERGGEINPILIGEELKKENALETVGGRNGYTTSMRARSSIGRSCMSVCRCAGVGDVGYIARWTMEITNHSHATIELPVGLRVAQILFYEVGETDKHYSGKYGQSSEWSPYDMLPRLYNDPDMRLTRPTQGE